MSFEATIDDAETDSELETVLRSFGVQSFVPIAPWFRHLEGNDVDRWGNEIQLIDMTDDYAVSFAEELDPEDLDLLRAFPEIRYIAPVPETEFYFTPNDQYFEDQWYLENNGQSLDYQVSPSCDDTMIVADYDIDATSAWNSVLSPGCLIGLIDTGIGAVMRIWRIASTRSSLRVRTIAAMEPRSPGSWSPLATTALELPGSRDQTRTKVRKN